MLLGFKQLIVHRIKVSGTVLRGVATASLTHTLRVQAPCLSHKLVWTRCCGFAAQVSRAGDGALAHARGLRAGLCKEEQKDVTARWHIHPPRGRGLDEGPEGGGCSLNTGANNQWVSGFWSESSRHLLVPPGPVSLASLVPLPIGS